MIIVRFVGDYFVLTTNVVASDDDQAIENAIANLRDHHGDALVDALIAEAYDIEVDDSDLVELDDSDLVDL